MTIFLVLGAYAYLGSALYIFFTTEVEVETMSDIFIWLIISLFWPIALIMIWTID